jgi:uncharacterized membrane protein HdeD (DUF308 family)
MFIGHYGVSLASKPLRPSVPLWVWFTAVQWMDVVWSILVLFGIEKLRIVPGFTEANAFDLYYMPYSHSLPGSIVLSLLFGAIVALFVSENRATTFLLVAAASFSHWILDLIVHLPDLPLYDDTAKVGFGLWKVVALSFSLELSLLGVGAWLYARWATFKGASSRYLYWGFVAILAGLQVIANFGPSPSSGEMTAIVTLAFYIALSLLAAWIEDAATTTTCSSHQGGLH